MECVVRAWAVIDKSGEHVSPFIAASPREVGRKVVGNRYDAFRLEVSPSYRELFDRDVQAILVRENWRIVPVKRRARGRTSAKQLELKLN
jgi:hypothetical protein